MIPLKDMTPRRSVPIMTILLIAANIAVFAHQLSLPPAAAEKFINTYALIPWKMHLALEGRARIRSIQAFLPLITCMFLHGGFLHIIGNMWFLWIFGGNVEDRLGSFIYLLLYFICGVGSGLTQAFFSWGSHVPSLGASGAISGVLGAYLDFLPGFANTDSGAALHYFLSRANPGVRFYRPVVRGAISERVELNFVREQRRSRVVGSRGGLLAGRSIGACA